MSPQQKFTKKTLEVGSCWIHSLSVLVRDYAKPTTTYYILPHNPVSSYCYSLWCWEPSAAGNAAGSTRREAEAAAAPRLNPIPTTKKSYIKDHPRAESALVYIKSSLVLSL